MCARVCTALPRGLGERLAMSSGQGAKRAPTRVSWLENARPMVDPGNGVGEDQPHSTDATPAFVLPDGLLNALRSPQSRARQYPAAEINDRAE